MIGNYLSRFLIIFRIFLKVIRSLSHKQKNNITKEVIDISWYRDDDGVIITDKEFGSDCAECSMFCQEGTISVPCNGERTDCPYYKEVDTYEYDKKLKTQTIEQIKRWCIDNSIIDYEEEFSDNGDCLVVLSKLEKFLDSLEDK
jgi:hypothetical protein